MTALFFSMQDPRVTQAYLMDVRARGYTTGVYVAWNWPEFESGTGAQFAEKVSEKLGDDRSGHAAPRTSPRCS